VRPRLQDDIRFWLVQGPAGRTRAFNGRKQNVGETQGPVCTVPAFQVGLGGAGTVQATQSAANVTQNDNSPGLKAVPTTFSWAV
jgi:hypothetical protein